MTSNIFNDEPIGTPCYNDAIRFVPPVSSGFVIKVYDGDTITIASRLPYPESPLYRFSVRVNGIDCPEIRTKNSNEKECAQLAKEYLQELLLNKSVILKNVDTDKYGRLLADVYIDNENISDLMIKNRFAVKYDGGTKSAPEDWMKYHIGC
jgi:micrococcal nuclease